MASPREMYQQMRDRIRADIAEVDAEIVKEQARHQEKLASLNQTRETMLANYEQVRRELIDD